MKEFLRYILYTLTCILVLNGCSSTKFVPDNQYLLDKVEIISDNEQFKPADLKEYLQQRPNFKVFGLMKWQLYLYNWSGKNENNWFNKQFRRMGEAPVLMDTTLITLSEKELHLFLVNKGYINAQVTHSIDTSKYKKATVTYTIKSNEPYRIRDYQMRLNDPAIDSIARIKPRKHSWLSTAFHSSSDEYTSLIQDSILFDRDILDQERERITKLLRYRGYYGFNKEYLTYLADSSFRKNVADLEMYLKPYRKLLPDGNIQEMPHRPYYLNKITILSDYDPLKPEKENALQLTDTLYQNHIEIIYGKNGRFIRPSVLARSVYLAPGRLYNERSVEQTYSSFARLRALKNINLRFQEFEENDSLKLNCTILTSPSKLQGFGVDL